MRLKSWPVNDPKAGARAADWVAGKLLGRGGALARSSFRKTTPTAGPSMNTPASLIPAFTASCRKNEFHDNALKNGSRDRRGFVSIGQYGSGTRKLRMLAINEKLLLPESEITWSFARAGGPGGQNVNKVASKAILRWNLAANQTLSADVKARFAHQERGRITSGGEVIIQSQRFRDQGARNRQDCLEKLLEDCAGPLSRSNIAAKRGQHEGRRKHV